MGLGVGAAAAWGAGAAAAAGAGAALSMAAGVLAAAAWGAVIGAAIGGLTSAVTGGSIGKGMLYGAIGGAVAGGIGGYFSLGSSAGSTLGSSAGGSMTPATLNQSVSGGAYIGSTGSGVGGAGSSVASAGTANASSGILGEIGTEVAKGGVEGLIKLGGNAMQAKAQSDAAEAKLKSDTQQAALNREHQLQMQREAMAGQAEAAGAHIPVDHFDEELAWSKEKFGKELEQRRDEMNAPREDAETARKRSGSVLAGMTAIRKGAMQQAAPSIQEQTYANSQGYTADAPQLVEGEVVA